MKQYEIIKIINITLTTGNTFFRSVSTCFLTFSLISLCLFKVIIFRSCLFVCININVHAFINIDL